MDNLKDQVARLLHEWDLDYRLNEAKSRFELDIPMDNADVSINIVYNEEGMRLYNISCLTFNLPKERATEVLYAINKIHNTSFSLAHLYLGEQDCRLAAQATVDVPEGGLDSEVFRYFVISTCELLDESFPGIMAVAFGTNAGEVASEPGKDTDDDANK